MLRKILAVDHAYARRIAMECGQPHFPAAYREVVEGHDGLVERRYGWPAISRMVHKLNCHRRTF